jgi:hypothetical protein
MSKSNTPTHEAISRRAYELFLERGGRGGDPVWDWLRAEAELTEAAKSAGDGAVEAVAPEAPAPPARPRKTPTRRAAPRAAKPAATRRKAAAQEADVAPPVARKKRATKPKI